MSKGHRGGHSGPPMGRPVEKAKNFKGTLKRLISYLKPYKNRFCIVFLLAILSTVFAIAGPKVNGKAIDKLYDGVMNKVELKILKGEKKLLEGQEKISEGKKKLAVGQAQRKILIEQQKKMQAQKKTLIDKKSMIEGMIKKNPAASAAVKKNLVPLEKGIEQITKGENKIKGILDKISFGEKQLSKGQKSITLAQKKLKLALKLFKITPTKEGVNAKINKIMKENGGKIDFKYIGQVLLFLIGLYLISALFTYIMQYIMSGVSQKSVFSMRRDVNDKLGRLPLKYFDSRTNGEILSRVTNDLDTVSTTLQQSLTQLITSVVTIIGIIIMMLTISPLLTLIMLITLPVSGFVTVSIAKKSQKYFAEQQKHLGELSGHVEEMFTGHKIVKAFGHEKKAIDEFNEVNEKLYKVGWKAQFVSGIIFPLLGFVSNIAYVFICMIGGILVTKNKLKLGGVTSFIQYTRQFTQPIVQTANIANIIQSTVAAAERVFELLDEEEQIPEKEDAKVIKLPKGEVKFENVKFGYKEDITLIENMNIDVKQGQTIAIVGPTGAGKTTLVNLLMRFYELNGGKITVDGVDITELKRGDLRTMFGMVLQDTWLFKGTIRDNIAYGREGAKDEDIIKAAKAAHADHFIRTLPEGYKTILNEEASNISQGQKQLLTIARAILADPSILILDEATSSVDTRTEVFIQKAMANLMKGRTSFVIAHRLSTIRDADLILVMNHGSIIEQGNHKELLDKGGFYANLYNSQFTGADLEGEVV